MTQTQKEHNATHCRQCGALIITDSKAQDGLCGKCKRARNRGREKGVRNWGKR